MKRRDKSPSYADHKRARKAEGKANSDGEDSELEYDPFGGRGSRKVAVTFVDSDSEGESKTPHSKPHARGKGKEPAHEVDDDVETKKMGIKGFRINREFEEQQELEFDENQRIEGFNLDQEMEEGHFDEAGNYIVKKDENRDKDNWLEGLSVGSVKKVYGRDCIWRC